MATYIVNGTVNNTTSTIVAAGNNYNAMVIRVDGADATVNIGAAAASGTGEIITDGTSSTFTQTNGQLVSLYTTGTVTYSVRIAG